MRFYEKVLFEKIRLSAIQYASVLSYLTKQYFQNNVIIVSQYDGLLRTLSSTKLLIGRHHINDLYDCVRAIYGQRQALNNNSDFNNFFLHNTRRLSNSINRI